MSVVFRHVRAGLRSRNLFRNWFSAGLTYLFYRLGVIGNRAVKVVLKDGRVALTELDRFGRIINAYYDGLISVFNALITTSTQISWG